MSTITAITHAQEFVRLWQAHEDREGHCGKNLTITMTGSRDDDRSEWTCWVFNDQSVMITMEYNGQRVVQTLRSDSDPLIGKVVK